MAVVLSRFSLSPRSNGGVTKGVVDGLQSGFAALTFPLLVGIVRVINPRGSLMGLGISDVLDLAVKFAGTGAEMFGRLEKKDTPLIGEDWEESED
jgi:hypothetical protein